MTINPTPGGIGWDWKSFIQSLPTAFQKELDLTALVPGDHVLIKTRNALYLFSWQGAEMAELCTNSQRAPSGPIRIMGCSFGLSSSIRPDALFCGGNLEFTYQAGEKTWTTSEIDEIHHLHRDVKTPTPAKP
jgi:hypothetical protein